MAERRRADHARRFAIFKRPIRRIAVAARSSWLEKRSRQRTFDRIKREPKCRRDH
jgi:hypothetical protein